jgi:hypothetical protein
LERTFPNEEDVTEEVVNAINALNDLWEAIDQTR